MFTFHLSEKKSIDLRTVMVDGEPWFVAKDVCEALGVSKSRDAVARLDEDEKGAATVGTHGGPDLDHPRARPVPLGDALATGVGGEVVPAAVGQADAGPADVVTMTSLEIVDFINEDRKSRCVAKETYVRLRHDDFCRKVPKVLGEERARNFAETFPVAGPNGATRQSPGYRFPKREACLMAMSYSYELQAGAGR